MSHQTRRQFVSAISAGIGLSLTGCNKAVSTRPTFSDYPFKLGVASGDPDTNGFVIWTRLAPDLRDGGMLEEPAIAVNWQVATDEKMQQVVRDGIAVASSDWGHSVHVEVDGLDPGRPYWYRFRAGGEISPIGRCITFPVEPTQLRFAVASCQNYEVGIFGAYQHLVDQNPDFVLFLGDYIYESNKDVDEDGAVARRHNGVEPETLQQYRQRLVQYKVDPDLQTAHAAMPWLVTWDDHEVDNDYAGLDNYQDVEKTKFAVRRAAAYKAYYEHMPLRLAQKPDQSSAQMYRGFKFGSLASMSITDMRQYRDNQACRIPGKKPGSAIGDHCAERTLESRTMLGEGQEQWLDQRMAESESQWNIIAQQQYINPLRQFDANGDTNWWADDWNGYPAARERLLNSITRHNVSNPVFIAGDIHSFWAIGIPADRSDFSSEPIATEFVTGAVTSPGPPYDYFMSLMPSNPHVRFFESRVQGYTICSLDKEHWRTDFHSVDITTRNQPKHEVFASFEVEPGNPEPQRI
jgi:alkaline phosphatase D